MSITHRSLNRFNSTIFSIQKAISLSWFSYIFTGIFVQKMRHFYGQIQTVRISFIKSFLTKTRFGSKMTILGQKWQKLSVTNIHLLAENSRNGRIYNENLPSTRDKYHNHNEFDPFLKLALLFLYRGIHFEERFRVDHSKVYDV